jgi:hypothetical protein
LAWRERELAGGRAIGRRKGGKYKYISLVPSLGPWRTIAEVAMAAELAMSAGIEVVDLG